MKRCLEPGCRTLTPNSRCGPHQRARRRVYDNTQWARLSRAVRATTPWCETCGATEDLTADHIEPRSLAAGVRTLCRSCNSSRKDGRG